MLKFTCPNCNSHKLCVSYNAQTQAQVAFDGIGPFYHKSKIASEAFNHYFCEDCGTVLHSVKSISDLRQYLENQNKPEESKEKPSNFCGTVIVRPCEQTKYCNQKFLVEYRNPDNPNEVDFAQLVPYAEELTDLLFMYPNATIKFTTTK